MTELRNLLKRLLLVTLILVLAVAWWRYDDWKHVLGRSADVVNQSVKDVADMVPAEIDFGMGKNGQGKTTVYKWKDESGKWHVSNERPEGIPNVLVQEYSVDQNVIPSTPADKKKRTKH